MLPPINNPNSRAPGIKALINGPTWLTRPLQVSQGAYGLKSGLHSWENFWESLPRSNGLVASQQSYQPNYSYVVSRSGILAL